MQKINDRIKLFRAYKNLKQKDFSIYVGIPISSLSEIESGKRSANVDLIAGITKQFPDVNPDWLLTGEGEMLRNSVYGKKSSYESSLKGQKVAELFDGLNEAQQREIFSVIEEKKQFNVMRSQLDKLLDNQDQQQMTG